MKMNSVRKKRLMDKLRKKDKRICKDKNEQN